ncbi:MAG: metal ABC transporter permease [Ilumatobacteraceae bacterium]
MRVQWLTDPFRLEFMQRALVATVVIGVVAPAVGVWVVLRRMANLGDAMAHGTLAGVALAYAAGVGVLLGALGAGVLIAAALLWLSASRRLGQETVVAIVGTALFALGVVVISRLDTGVELTHLLFGRVLTVTWSDVVLASVLGAVALATVLALFGELRLATFDHVQAEQVGVRVETVQAVLVVLLAVVVVVSLRVVGTIMSVTMLVTPAATARLATRTLRTMTLVAIALGVGEGIVGLVASYHLGSAPGATIGLVAAGFFALVYAITLPRRMPHHHRPLD